MTTFAELQTLVEDQTRRPEIPLITQAAIRSATLRAHHVDFFPRDLVSGSLSYELTNSVFTDFASIHSLLERLRALKTIMSIDPVSQAPTEQLEFREVDDLYDQDGNRRAHIYTLVGDTLRCYFSSQTGLAYAYYYQNPNISNTAYSSWIANTYPDEIAQWAAAIVFARSGYLEMAQNHQEIYVKPFKEMLIAAHLLGNVS